MPVIGEQIADLESTDFPEEDLYSIWASTTDVNSGDKYRYIFSLYNYHGQYIKIDSRLTTQPTIVDLARSTQQLAGGEFVVHPYYGAVWGSPQATVVSGYLTKHYNYIDRLSMTLWMNGNSPNARNYQQADSGGCGARWLAEAGKFNGPAGNETVGGLSRPQLSASYILELLNNLEQEQRTTDTTITAVYDTKIELTPLK